MSLHHGMRPFPIRRRPTGIFETTVSGIPNTIGAKDALIHAGVDRDTGLVHTISVTPANESDVVHGSDVLTGEEEEVYGDAGYLGMANRIETETGSKPKARFHISAARALTVISGMITL